MRIYNKYKAGQKFGKLTLIERLPGGQKWRCRCDCGAEVVTQISGGSRGCYLCSHKSINIKHGHNRNGTPDRLYRIWIGMKSRCHNSNDTGFDYYGARGITVCDEWKDDFQAFYDWSMLHGYSDELSIDRIDVNGNYEPSNCRWITMVEQQRNKRKDNNHD